jgi:YggT family protein
VSSAPARKSIIRLKEDDRMFVLGNLFDALAFILHYVLWLYILIVTARAVISWVSPDPYNPIVQFLYRATEPVLEPIRRKLPGGGFGLDFSPLIVILALYFLDMFLVTSLQGIAFRLR